MPESSNDHFNHDNHINHVIAPEAPVTSGGTPLTPEAPKNPNKKRRNIILSAIGAVAAGSLALGLSLGLNSGQQSHGEQPPKATETSAPATPNPTETHAATGVEAPVLTGEALTQAYIIPEGLSGNDLGRTFIQKIQDWGQYGENLDTQASHVGANGADNLEAQSEAGGEAIAAALIPSDRLTSPIMSTFKDTMVKRNISIVDAWTKTFAKTKEDNAYPYVDKEPFNQTLEFHSATEVSTDTQTGSITMDIKFTQHTDLKNRVDPTQESTINPDNSGFTRDGINSTWRVEFVHDNGTIKIISVIVEPQ